MKKYLCRAVKKKEVLCGHPCITCLLAVLARWSESHGMGIAKPEYEHLYEHPVIGWIIITKKGEL
ncbi:MAG: hypothetical protein KKE62_17565 [Proteobacteria bacterium]|nr:hypothetical protein [Pseudomonadota bacterium]MBU1386532.1 hypothetical protein [Pseudomonadota bacterium]MBU1544643.1 hypothetical protein [Pseudomonadota bacterium]MBU2431122.1 hypothetical protein [Pseudomonadota bacterium]MBU2481378.1 hypothetical protein [Pseudomonadota bacterium]